MGDFFQGFHERTGLLVPLEVKNDTCTVRRPLSPSDQEFLIEPLKVHRDSSRQAGCGYT